MTDKNIYTLADFEERLSELAIGSEDAQKLSAFVERKVGHTQWMQRRLDEAYRIIGSNVIDECVEYD